MGLIEAFELHSPRSIREGLAAGARPTTLIDGKRPVNILIEMYTRSSQFAACLRVLLDAGASVGDPLLEAVLLDDDAALLTLDTSSKMSLSCAYTCCDGVTALHLCAEFNSLRCARALIDAGADLNARADIDNDGARWADTVVSRRQ